jgi:hypothetical protein
LGRKERDRWGENGDNGGEEGIRMEREKRSHIGGRVTGVWKGRRGGGKGIRRERKGKGAEERRKG